MDKYIILSPEAKGSFNDRLNFLYLKLGNILDTEKLENRTLQYCKAMNQHQALIAILMLQLGYIIFNLLLFHIGCNFTWILCIDIITYTLLHIFTTHRLQKAKK